MFTLVSNEGKQILVPLNIFQKVKQSFTNGDFAIIYKDEQNEMHIIIVPHQIDFFNQTPIQ